MKSKRLLSMLLAAAMVAGSMPVTVFAGRLDYEPEETEVPQITETEEEKETSKPTVKETKPEVKETEPEVKETEPEVKETEPEVKETEAPKAEETEETVKADEEKPEENEKADEPVTDKAPEASVSVKARNAADFIDKEIKFSNGKLSWNAIDGAVNYRIVVGSSEVYTTNTSYEVGKWIDEMIKNREIYKDNAYDVLLVAYDADDSRIAMTQFDINYKSSAEPATKLPEVTNLKISNGVLTWDVYDNNGNSFAGYDIRVTGVQTFVDHVYCPDSSFNLKNFVDECISNGGTELPSYKIQVVALEDGSWKPIAESGFIIYNYKKVNTITVKAKTVKAKKRKKKNQSFKVKKVLTVKKAQGKVTYTKVSGNAKIVINKASGKLTVKKKMKRGTYKIRIAVKAAGNATYATATKTVTVKVKVR